MNKHELVDAVAAKSGMSKKDSALAIESVFGAIAEAMEKGESVQVSGFGSFEVKARAAKVARNPRTGETIAVPASKAPDFKASKVLKDAVNK